VGVRNRFHWQGILEKLFTLDEDKNFGDGCVQRRGKFTRIC